MLRIANTKLHCGWSGQIIECGWKHSKVGQLISGSCGTQIPSC